MIPPLFKVNFDKQFYYLGWIANLFTCCLAGFALLYFTWNTIVWLGETPFKFKAGAFIAGSILTSYSCLVGWDTFQWLKQPAKEFVFDFLIWWILLSIIFGLAFCVAFLDIDGASMSG